MTNKNSELAVPEWCEQCNRQGYYFPENYKKPALVIHQKCGYICFSAWCETCRMGFTLPVENIKTSKSWNCPNCNKNTPVSQTVFQNPIDLFTEDELPEDVCEKVAAKNHSSLRNYCLMDEKAKLSWERLLMVCLGFFILAIIHFFPISEIWKSHPLQAEGSVIGQNCANQYVVIKFTDIYGRTQQTNNPNEKLSGDVTIHYRIVKYPWQDDYAIEVQQDSGFINSINSILFILAMIFILSGSTGYLFGIPKRKFKLKLK